jgi:hypothetical protein
MKLSLPRASCFSAIISEGHLSVHGNFSGVGAVLNLQTHSLRSNPGTLFLIKVFEMLNTQTGDWMRKNIILGQTTSNYCDEKFSISFKSPFLRPRDFFLPPSRIYEARKANLPRFVSYGVCICVSEGSCLSLVLRHDDGND